MLREHLNQKRFVILPRANLQINKEGMKTGSATMAVNTPNVATATTVIHIPSQSVTASFCFRFSYSLNLAVEVVVVCLSV